MPYDVILLLISIVVLWIGAGISISGVERISRSIRISSFLVSFFALGFLTSISELSVAYFSLVDKTPSISVGNLIGGSTAITLLIIPLLTILNKGIKFDEKSQLINFPFAYLVISLPVLLVLDKTLSTLDAVLMIFSVTALAITISVKNTLIDKLENVINHKKTNLIKQVFKILVGMALIVLSCKYIVDFAVAYAVKFSISPFLIGVIFLSVGTNLPELTVLIKSTFLKKKSIALGDYIGSAALNTLTLGFLTLFNKASININGGLKYNIFLLPLGALLFVVFTKDKKLERREGAFLLLLYVVFVVIELVLP